MKIAQLLDTEKWAIGHLASAVREYNQWIDWDVVVAHPKAIERGELDTGAIAERLMKADIIDANYWRTLSQLVTLHPELKTKKILLTHHNEKNLLDEDWSYVTHHIVETQRSLEILSEHYSKDKITLIPVSYDHTQIQWNDNYPHKYIPAQVMVGYVGRIVPWKGLKEIVRACYELGYKLLVMGAMDKPSYFQEIPEEQREIIDWSYFNCADEERQAAYNLMHVFVANSGSGRETGTMPLLEAAAVGVPIVTTRAGIANDIFEDGVHAAVVDYDDYEGLKFAIKNVIEAPALQYKLRDNAWKAAKGLNHERRAQRYARVFKQLFYGDAPVVSVIVPHVAEDNITPVIDALSKQTYPHTDVILYEDASDGYNLARVRNEAAIMARGEYLMFCDSRIVPAPDAVEQFLKHTTKDKKEWLFGEKGGNKEHFVENFSFIRRDQYIAAGMCSERINEYGGMSQELRERFMAQGFALTYVPEAKATTTHKSSMNAARRSAIIRMKNRLDLMYGA